MDTASTNPFKTAMAAGETRFGLWLAMANPYTAEIAAGAGFDWLLVDNEHAPNDLRSTLAQLQALAAYGAHPVVRPPIGDTVLVKQLLDIGAKTLLVPMIDTAEQAARMVAATRYPPAGVRGVGAAIARASRWNRVPDYLQQADDGICLLVQCESTTAIDNLDEIVAVDGVDGVFFGPADLSASMGLLGQGAHPDVRALIGESMKRVRAAGKAPGVLCPDAELARHYIDCGAQFVAVGSDTGVFAGAIDALAARWKR
jgi:4-hydroxy-2-oxoheptanedioate aldolase